MIYHSSFFHLAAPRLLWDDRVEQFVKQHTSKLTVIDTKTYQTGEIDNAFRPLLSPMISAATVTDRLAKHFEAVTGHSLEIRRYYRKLTY